MKKYLVLTLLFLPFFVFAQEASTTATTTATTTPEVVVKNVHNKKDVENEVHRIFKDVPIMIEVARCESKFRQFTDAGNVLHGGTDNKMIGIYQIYEDIHRAKALSLGMDINTVDGNIRYAEYLYKREGTSPWISSMPCWNPKPTNEQTPDAPALDTNLIFGMSHPEVVTLQQILNKNGYKIANDGPGSPGNETTMFGNLTRLAVRKFQCDQNIVCTGDEYTTAYGVVGPRTRIALSNFTPGTTPPKPTVDKDAIRAKIADLKKQIAELEAQL